MSFVYGPLKYLKPFSTSELLINENTTNAVAIQQINSSTYEQMNRWTDLCSTIQDSFFREARNAAVTPTFVLANKLGIGSNKVLSKEPLVGIDIIYLNQISRNVKINILYENVPCTQITILILITFSWSLTFSRVPPKRKQNNVGNCFPTLFWLLWRQWIIE